MHDILEQCNLGDLAYVGSVQIDISLLTTLVEWWDLDYGTFHLPPTEMTMSLDDVYCIWDIPIRGALVFQREMDDDKLHEVKCLWLTRFDDHDCDHHSVRLAIGCHFPKVG